MSDLIPDTHHRLLIIGGGPAGSMAAIAAARLGVKVTLIDENPLPGGQIYRQLPLALTVEDGHYISHDQHRGAELIRQLEQYDIEVLANTTVWGCFVDKQITINCNGETRVLHADTIVFATGTYERVIPFPGWTLPGVITTGGTQRLLKNQGILPGENIILAGTGPLQLIVAVQLQKAGANVVAVVDASRLPYTDMLQFAPAFWGHWDILKQAASSFLSLKRAGIPYLRGHAVVAAEGERNVQRVLVKQVQNTWHSIDGTERWFEVDTVCTGFGFLPAYELPALAQCRLIYSTQYQAWVPWHDQDQQTSVQGIFVAGDGAGVAGVSTALAQGELAGIMAARYLGFCSNAQAQTLSADIRRRLNKLSRLRKALDHIYAIKPGIYTSLQDDTLVCRCEEVRYGVIRDSITLDNITSPSAIKLQTRAGMGLCQGRYCGMTISACIHRHTGEALESLDPYTPRPPIRPVTISSLIR